MSGSDYPIVLFGLSGLPGTVVRGLILTAGAAIWTLMLVRLLGLRALSKADAFDFIATVATASLIAQAASVTDWSDYVQAITAISGIFLLQWLFARARLASSTIDQVISNQPRLLLRDGHFLEDAMRDARISKETLLEKLRSSSVNSLGEVKAVVLETTGEFSVIKGELKDELLKGVRGYESN